MLGNCSQTDKKHGNEEIISLEKYKKFPQKGIQNKRPHEKGVCGKLFLDRQKKKATKLFPGKNANIFVKKGYLEFKKMSREKEVCGTHTLTWSAR